MEDQAKKTSFVNEKDNLAFTLSEEEKNLINISEKVKAEKSPYYFGQSTTT